MGKHWRSRGTSWTTFIWPPISWSVMRETIRRSFNRTWMGEKFRIGNVCSFNRKTRLFLSIHVDDMKMAGKKDNIAPMWKKLMKNRWSCWTHIISWSRIFGMQTEWNYWGTYKDVWLTFFCWSNWKFTRVGKTLTQKQSRGPTRWKYMLGNALSEIAIWHTKRPNRFTKSQVLACMITNSRRKNSNQLEKCQKCAHNLSENACTWHEIGWPDIFWSDNKLARAVTKWIQACDRRLARLISYIFITQMTTDNIVTV